eukprot:TRINITY_DN4120_c0_g1_i1.p1 TRINITY_DN4120_c0_g1~~TRINITY_DN4120_c0_g1_i1.p1  ORF type:complete len:779 (+),score=158.69 TRINITY_DN4120_c0_g1_i1:42-2378(+)
MVSKNKQRAFDDIFVKIQSCLKDLDLGDESINHVIKIIHEEIRSQKQNYSLPSDDARIPAILDIVTNEKNYVENLKTVISKYLTPLKNLALFDHTDLKRNKSITSTEIESLFGNIEEIFRFHLSMHQSLETCITVWPQVPIGKIFERMIPGMKMYVQYSNNHDFALNTLQKIENTKMFSSFIQKVSQNGTKDLEILLNMPLKHLSQYRMQLKVLTLKTPEKNEDRESLNKAQHELKKIQNLIHLNRQHQTVIEEIQKHVNGFKENVGAKPGRVLICEGDLNIVISGKEKKNYHIYLLNDVLVYTKHGQGGNYHYKGKIILDGASHKDGAMAYDASTSNTFLVMNQDGVSFPFIASSAAEKVRWLQFLDSATNFGDQNKVFGIRLTDIMNRDAEQGAIPQVIEKIIQLLDEAVCTEGLFRLSGRASATASCISALDSGVPVDLSEVESHVLANLLKQFLRDLPVPLIPPELKNSFLTALVQPSQKEQIEALREALEQLHPAHWNLLEAVMKFLDRVSQHQEVNKMNASNLAVVLAPNIMPIDLPDVSEADLRASMKIVSALEQLIVHNAAIFLGGPRNLEKSAPKFEYFRVEGANTSPAASLSSPTSKESSPTSGGTTPTLSRRSSSLSVFQRSKKKEKKKEEEDTSGLKHSSYPLATTGHSIGTLQASSSANNVVVKENKGWAIGATRPASASPLFPTTNDNSPSPPGSPILPFTADPHAAPILLPGLQNGAVDRTRLNLITASAHGIGRSAPLTKPAPPPRPRTQTQIQPGQLTGQS